MAPSGSEEDPPGPSGTFGSSLGAQTCRSAQTQSPKRAPLTPHTPNRRARPRTHIVVQEVRLSFGTDVFFGCALDISRGGLFISAVRKRSPGEVHEIRFRLPGLDHEFACRACVLWVRRFEQGSRVPPGFGLKFLDLPEGEAVLIDRWVAEAESEAAPE